MEERFKTANENSQLVMGEPLTIRQVAKLIGCSAWTIRQKLIPAGLPCMKSSEPGGRWIFYKDLVTAWILKRQKK